MIKKYKSMFSPDKEITAAQFILELLCKNKAASLKKTLPLGFSQLPEWSDFFKSQLRKCYKYLEEYHPDIIISVISKKNIYSLYADWIDNEFKKEHNRVLNITETISDTIIPQRITKNTGKTNKDLTLDMFE